MEANAVDYTNLLPLIAPHKRDWVIEWCEVDKIHPTVVENQKPRGEKIEVYMKLMKQGVVFPPIVVDENYLILDGWHRWLSVTNLHKKKTPVIKSVGVGTNKILRDECFQGGSFTLPYQGMTEENPSSCLVCGKQLIHVRERESPTPPWCIPMGMPVGPYFFCDMCGIIVKPQLFVVWKSA